MTNLKITIEFWKEGNFYIARAPELDMVSQGETLEEAKRNLIEVVEIQFEEMKKLGTLDEFLEDTGYIVKNDVAESVKEILGFDKSLVKVPPPLSPF